MAGSPGRTNIKFVLIQVSTDEQAGELLEKVAQLKRDGIIRTVPHMVNNSRTIALLTDKAKNSFASLTKPTSWHMLFSLSGPEAFVRGQKKVIRQQLKGFPCRIIPYNLFHFLDKLILKKVSFRYELTPLRELFNIYRGEATNYFLSGSLFGHPEHRRFLDNYKSIEFEKLHFKMIWISPVFPAQKEHLLNVLAIFKRQQEKYKFRLAFTVSIMDKRSACVVANFGADDRVEGDVVRLNEVQEIVTKDLIAHGYPPYRLSARFSNHVIEDSDYLRVMRKIKAALDEKNIIGSGKFNL